VLDAARVSARERRVVDLRVTAAAVPATERGGIA
jgi:hypothetical protein